VPNHDFHDGPLLAGLVRPSPRSLLGGVCGLVLRDTGAWPFLGGILGLSLLLAVSYREAFKKSGSLSITTAVAALLAFVLGTLAARGAPVLALSAAVVTAVLLDLKPTLHRWLQLMQHRELTAAFQMMVLSVVILPNLPDVGYGPYQALNPYRIWWAVVLIAGLSLAGHFAMRLTGARRGVLWTGLLGGLASSTATTLALSRLARQQPALAMVAAAGALAASGVMFLRMLMLVAAIQPPLARILGIPLVASAVALILLAVRQWRGQPADATSVAKVEPMAAFDLGTALGFGALLAALAVLVPAAKQWLGDVGIYALAAVSGLADVDATVISMSRLQASGGLSVATTVVAIGLTTMANMGSKAGIAWVTGGSAVGWPVLRGYAVGLVVGMLAALGSLLV
jgi:uncharacterized membrane protein (DUF4010 family)